MQPQENHTESTMTDSTSKPISDDTMGTDESPNERARKKTKDDLMHEDRDAMDCDTDPLQPRNIFGSSTSSQNQNNKEMTGPTPHNNNDKLDRTAGYLDPLTNEDKDSSNDAPNGGNSKTSHPSYTNPYLENIDLADDLIWTMPIAGPNALWKPDQDWDLSLPYTPGEIAGDTCDYNVSLEAHLNLACDYIDKDDDKEMTQVDEWMHLFAHALFDFREEEVLEDDGMAELKIYRQMAIRLALTDPVDLFPASSWKNGSLRMIYNAHTAWVACYCMFGAPWKNREHWFTSAPPPQSNLKRKSGNRAPDDAQKTVGFQSSPPSESEKTPDTGKPQGRDVAVTPKPKAVANSMYLNKALLSNPRHAKKVQGMKDLGRKFRTYVKLKFSKFNSDIVTEQAEEVSTCFKTMMDKVWNVDSSVLILAWKDGAISKPLRSRSEFPKSKDGLVGYLDNLWMQKGRAAYCRAVLSHDMSADQLFQDSDLQVWLDGLDLGLHVDRIQAQRVGNAGHLLGYHALVANTENLADAIQNQLVMGNIAVEVRSEFVRFGNKKQGPAQRTNTKILQIYTSWDSTSRARRALVEIYSSKANGSYPLGVQARFIPNVTDTRFIRTPESLLAHTNSLKKHIKFMSNTCTSQCHTIIELDHYNEEIGMTLRRAIMHIFSSSMDNCTLFLAVDTSFYGDCVNFAYREELENEAITMITALPIFLFASLGRRSVWNWFTSEARDEAAYYRWDQDLGIVPVDDMDANNTKLASWEQLDDVDEEDDGRTGEPILQPFRLLLEETGENGYNDNGTIRTQIYRDRAVATDQDSASNDYGIIDIDDDGSSQANLVTIDSSQTSTTPSTLTKTPDKDALLAEMAADPEMIEKFERMMLQRKSQAAQSGKHPATGTGRQNGPK